MILPARMLFVSVLGAKALLWTTDRSLSQSPEGTGHGRVMPYLNFGTRRVFKFGISAVS
jgi:hypothetical protein